MLRRLLCELLPPRGSSHIYLSPVVRRVGHAVDLLMLAKLAHYADDQLLNLPFFTSLFSVSPKMSVKNFCAVNGLWNYGLVVRIL